MKMKNSTRTSGFSLVELLVVILIIVVIAAIAFPMARGMMSKAKIANATNCFRGNGVAIHQFAADNNQRFPGPLIWIQTAHTKGTLFSYLAPYLGTEKLPTTDKEIFTTAAYASFFPEYLRKEAAGNLSYGYFAATSVPYLARGDGNLQSIWGYGPNKDASGSPERPKTLSELLSISRLVGKRGSFDPESQLALLKTLSTDELKTSIQSDHLKGKVLYLYLDGHTELKPALASNKRSAGDF
ncbi:MAG: hypothetical protein RLZZ214_322 [Verrucomicrobiota bacterium]|jgi:prepilin-type N-terminal cleavage/methylation domain-containing protein